MTEQELIALIAGQLLAQESATMGNILDCVGAAARVVIAARRVQMDEIDRQVKAQIDADRERNQRVREHNQKVMQEAASGTARRES